MSTDEILTLEDRRYQAMVDADMAVLDELCAPELIYTHSNSTQDTKESYLKKVADGFFDYQWLEHPTDRVTIVNGTALVFGRMVGEVVNDGVLKKLNSRVLSVWFQQGETWKFVAFAPTVIPA